MTKPQSKVEIGPMVIASRLLKLSLFWVCFLGHASVAAQDGYGHGYRPLVSSAPPLQRAPQQALSLNADGCAIGYALTGQVLAGCAPPPPSAGRTRSVMPGDWEGYFVHFEFDSNTLTAQSQAHLQRLSGLLNGELAGLCVKLVGHTDTVGSAPYNMELSKRRAGAVRLFMAGPGRISSLRLKTKGQGESLPLAGLLGDDPRNRRVEILARPAAGNICP